MEEELYEDYIEDVISEAESFDISKEEVLYNDDHFRTCYEDNTSAEKAVFLLSSFCM